MCFKRQLSHQPVRCKYSFAKIGRSAKRQQDTAVFDIVNDINEFWQHVVLQKSSPFHIKVVHAVGTDVWPFYW